MFYRLPFSSNHDHVPIGNGYCVTGYYAGTKEMFTPFSIYKNKLYKNIFAKF